MIERIIDTLKRRTLLNTLIIGRGEIGNSLYELLNQGNNYVYSVDIIPQLTELNNAPQIFDVIHICIRHSENYFKIVSDYLDQYETNFVNICTTVPVGTTRNLQTIYPDIQFCHSTTRGLHPHLIQGLKNITKHISGPGSEWMKEYFEKFGVKCMAHPDSNTTELLHILNNCHYGINLMFADEAAKLCREYGVDYYDWMKYGETNNDGYIQMGHKTKVRPILTPPNGKIGGHCVNMSAGLIPSDKRSTLINSLFHYGTPKPIFSRGDLPKILKK